MRRKSLLRIALILGLFTSAIAPAARAQYPGYVTNSNDTGMPSYGSFISSEIDTVNVFNGGVTIHIPILTRKGRGIDVKMWEQSASKGWTVTTSVVPIGFTGYSMTYYNWEYTGGGGGPATNIGTQLQWIEQEYSVPDCATGMTNDAGTVITRSNWVYVDALGTQTQLPLRETFVINGYSSCLNGAPPSNLVAHSQSGHVKVDITNDTLNDHSGIKIYNENGAREFGPPGGSSFLASFGPEDTNGNNCCGSSSSNWIMDTLGRPLYTLSGSGNTTVMSYYDSNGNIQNVTLTYTTIYTSSSFPTTSYDGYHTVIQQNSSPAHVISQMTLPNGLSYSFSYIDPATGATNPYGEVMQITLPTGGIIKYKWETLPQQDPGPWDPQPLNEDNLGQVNIDGRYLAERDVSADGVHWQTWTYNYATGTVTDPVGNYEIHYGTGCGAVSGFMSYVNTPPFDGGMEYHDATGKLLRRVVKTWTCDGGGVYASQAGQDQPLGFPVEFTAGYRNPRVTSVTTTLGDTNQVTQTQTDFNDCYSEPVFASSYNECRSNPTEIREYNWGNSSPGALLRKTDFTYLQNSNSTYLNAHIWDRPASKIVYDGSGNTMAQTTYSYDTTAITSTSSVPSHDYTLYPASSTVRGNPTVASNWVNTTNSWLTTTNYYNDVGNLVQTTDARGNTYSLSYADNFTNASLNSNTQGFLTSVTGPTTNGVSHVEGKQYYYYTGLTAAVCGQNNPSPASCAFGESLPASDYASYTFDLLARPSTVTHGDGGITNFCFSDNQNPPTLPSPQITCASTSLPIQVQSISAIDNSGSNNLQSTALIDGLGRVKQTQLNSDPDGVDYVDTTYDLMSRVSTVSNPHRSSSSPTDGITTSEFDGLGRVTTLIPPDGSTTSNNVTTTFLGTTVTVMDQAGKQRKSYTDALGRLIEVDEPGAPPSGSGVSASNGYAMVSGSEQTYGVPGVGAVTITGAEQTAQGDPPCELYDCGGNCLRWGNPPTIYDWGFVQVTVNGRSESTQYGQGDVPSSVASRLATLFNNDSGSVVTASANGAVITLTAKTDGTATDYSLSATSWTDDSTGNFSYPSFSGTPSGSALTGGVNTYSDTGTAWINIGGTQVSVTYGSSSSASGIATALASAINASSSTLGVTASASSGAVNITENTQGVATSLSAGSTTNYPSTFAQPSFSVTPFASVLDQTANNVPLSLSTPAVTLYFYNGLNNLTCVEQHGNVTGQTGCSSSPSNDSSSSWRIRRFTYDSLSRLLTSSNPESGAVTNVYDSDSNCSSPNSYPGLLVSTKDARGIRTCLQYDNLNRITKRTFSDGATPAVTITYDGTTISGCSPTLSPTNPIARRTAMCDAAGWEAWSYDSRGHIVAERRSTNSVIKNTSYAYNFAGGVTSITYPSGRTVSYAYNSADQTTSATDTAHGITYASNAHYNPVAELATLQESGSNILFTSYYNNRLQPCRISVRNTGSTPGSCSDMTNIGNVLDLTYNYNSGTADNGNTGSITNNINTARSQTFSYDELNRVIAAKTQATTGTYAWGLSFGYDPWANLLSSTVTQGSAYQWNVAATNKNQMWGYSYDAAGNLLSDGTNSYTYNGEGELASAAGVIYTYDGDGDRVEKATSGSPPSPYKLYWYGVGTDPLSESDASGNITNEYIFLSGARIAMLNLSSGGVNYYVQDHLGSSRVVTNSSGAVLDDSDFYPFGGERAYLSSSGNNYKFTGKERDTESGLDDFAARFYSSQFGRFLSADDSKYIKASDPQTFNLYTYVANNPINAVDPTGHMGRSTQMNPLAPDVAQNPGSEELTQAENDWEERAEYQQWCTQNNDDCRAEEQSQEDASVQQESLMNNQPVLAESFTGAQPATPGPTDSTDESNEQLSDSKTTLTLGNQKVNITYSAVTDNSGRSGEVMDAVAEGCKKCDWAQVVSRTGDSASAPHTDRGVSGQPLYGVTPTISGANGFHDLPLLHRGGYGNFQAVTFLGNADVAKKSFTILGAMTWGYSIDKKGGFSLWAPRVITGSELTSQISILRKDSPTWTINDP